VGRNKARDVCGKAKIQERVRGTTHFRRRQNLKVSPTTTTKNHGRAKKGVFKKIALTRKPMVGDPLKKGKEGGDGKGKMVGGVG